FFAQYMPWPDLGTWKGDRWSANASARRRLCPLTEYYKQIYLPLTYSFIFVLGLLLNGTILWLSFRRTKHWTSTTIYLVNLTVADLLYVCSLPFLIVTYSLGDWWPFGEALCKLVRFLFYTNLYSSILLLTCISVHRFLGVCYPIRSMAYRTRRLALGGTGVSWALVVLQLLPTLVFSRTGFIDGQIVCYDLTSPDNFDQFFAYGMMLTVSGFILPFLIILVCYSLMIKSLVKPEETHTGGVVRAKSIRTILLVCGLFAICFVPFHVTRSVYLLVRVYHVHHCQVLKSVSMAYKIWRPLVSLNSCFNPLLYFLSGDSNRIRFIWELRHNRVACHPARKPEQIHFDREIGLGHAERTTKLQRLSSPPHPSDTNPTANPHAS
uniref:G-protein coupled receptors family 1 profile domain-containing protein n=1 Tax=Ornithorhynchus anatinus TaxID=9258 RepID=A0A6I8P9D5_ORNAN